MPEKARVLGVYSKTAEVDAGIGATMKKAIQRTYWFVRLMPDASYELRPLNAKHIPAGPTFLLSKNDFIKVYAPEPDFYSRISLPVLESLQQKLAKGEKHFVPADLDAAEKEFCKAVGGDSGNSKAAGPDSPEASDFCDYAHLKAILAKVMGDDATFKDEQSRLFNDVGIDLRKSRLFTEAVAYYNKALELNPRDENLHFNIARAYFDGQDAGKCREHLLLALEINPAFKEAKQFLAYCNTGGNGETKKVMRQMSE